MYKIEKNKRKNCFEIIELKTGFVVGSFKEYAPTGKRYRWLKNGGAFNGFTPRFILNLKGDNELQHDMPVE